MKRIIIVAFLLVVAGCSPEIQTYTDFDPDYELWDYSTFDWSQKTNIEAGENPIYYNELNDKRIKNAVLEQLSSRGYFLTDEKAELKVHYHIIVEDKARVSPEPIGIIYDPNWVCTQTNFPQYQEGTLILDIMDIQTNNLIWRGWAVSVIDIGSPPDQINQLIQKAVSKIFRKFPKAPKSPPAKANALIN